MKKIDLDELPKYSPWVARLLNIVPFQKPERTTAKIDAEYDKDKYAKLQQLYDQNPEISIQELMSVLADWSPPEKEVCVSRGNELFLVSGAAAQRLAKQDLLDILTPYITMSRTVIELGCGFGYNLAALSKIAPSHSFIGGEYSQNAVNLACKLFGDCPRTTVSQFNFYDETWPIFDDVSERALVFTRYAIEQLPSARHVISMFAKYEQKIACVIHIEPVFEFNNENSTLGLMRRSYTLLNDYNKDLYTCINEMGAKILRTEKDLFAVNPLNPPSLIAWQF